MGSSSMSKVEEKIEETISPKTTSSMNNGKPNVIKRVSTEFYKKWILVNERRGGENNLRLLSLPKFTELITRNKLWKHIENDLINYLLDEDLE